MSTKDNGFFDKQNWTKNTRQLLKHAGELVPHLPAYLFIRHSHRLDPVDPSQIAKEPITPIGLQVAEEFGQRLASICPRNILIYHSPLLRCQQTAEMILKGITARDGKATLKGVKSVLLDLEGNQKKIEEIEKDDHLNYVNYWVMGFYNPEIIEPACHYGLRIAKMLQTLNIQDPNTLVIMVGHDDRILGLRAVLAGIAVDRDWLPFLGGFILQFTSKSIKFSHRNQNGFQIPYPYWWPNHLDHH